MSLFHFPPWTNKIKYLLGAGLAGCILCIPHRQLWLLAEDHRRRLSTRATGPFSHALHSGQLAIDCRYCHTTVENAKHSAVPATETCMNCHSKLHTQVRSLPCSRQWEAVIQSSGYESTTCRIRLFQPRSARSTRYRLRFMPRTNRPHGGRFPT